MQRVRLSAQDLELLARGRAIGRLGEPALPERQRLIGAEHQPARLLHRHGQRLLPRQQRRDRAGIGKARVGFDAALVDIGGQHLDRDARALQQRAPARALGGEHKRLIGKPERHDAYATGCRRRSVSRLSTAAAVSSIERRVTSMLGQLCLAQSLRENATSSATALRSIYWSSS